MSSQATAAYPHKQAYSSPLPTTVVALKDETRSTVSKASNAQPRQHALVQRTVDRWTILPNLQDPKSYRRRDKVGIVFVVAIASFAGPFASNSLQPAFPDLQKDWNIPDTVVALTTTLFLCATGIAPLWYAFLSERYGRRPIYLWGFLIFSLASVVCALSTNIAMLLTFRFLQAVGASCAQSVGLGIIADIYVPAERGRATGWGSYYMDGVVEVNYVCPVPTRNIERPEGEASSIAIQSYSRAAWHISTNSITNL
ncbi:putative transporter C1348,05 [Rhizoctonia solani AG-1 IB]|uniref:Putative transporter C1348,05 n=1 Tax=Thanatephorus cucumeris (strain AG1-IB / isolate 7/3/14) TaxID=1108050 RepID=M5BP88_THACB|nr:putative transporter C1348,05 [Rhizoctonia solani AG-1 IB]